MLYNNAATCLQLSRAPALQLHSNYNRKLLIIIVTIIIIIIIIIIIYYYYYDFFTGLCDNDD